MREYETEDVRGVVAQGPEFGVGKAVDDEEDGGGDVADHGRPEGGDGPVFAGGNDNVEVIAELVALWEEGWVSKRAFWDGCVLELLRTYRVECQVPETLQEGVLIPEARCRCGWSLGKEDGNESAGEEDSKTEAGSGATADGVADSNTEDLSKEVSTVVDSECGFSSLGEDVFPAINGR